MTDTVENLILDLPEWAGSRERSLLPVREDANDRGLVERASANGGWV